MFKLIPSLNENQMNMFIGLFDPDTICRLHLDLYNGTGSRITELPNGGHVEQNQLSLTVMSFSDLKPALDSIIYNQIQKCSVSFREENRSACLNLLDRSLHLSGNWPMELIASMVKFCMENEVEKLSIRF